MASRGSLPSATEILRSKYLKLKDKINEWGAIDSTSFQSMEFFEHNYDRFCREIDQCISGDPVIIGDLNSLKDRLRNIRRRAVVAFQDAQIGADLEPEPVNLPHPESIQLNFARNRSVNLDSVFNDNDEQSSSRLYRTLPAYLPREQENVSGNTVVASGNGYCITTIDTGSTYARQFINSERSKTGTGEGDLSAVASGHGNRIITSDTGPTYARQVISSDKPRTDTIELDLSQYVTHGHSGWNSGLGF